MFDLLGKIFEAVAVDVDLEKKMRVHYKRVLNTKLKKSTWPTEPWYKFWLLTNGDIVPVKKSHLETADLAGVWYDDLEDQGAFAGSIKGDVLILGSTFSKKFTSKQISKLRNLYIEYKVKELSATVQGKYFRTPVKSSKELSYYLEYGKEEEQYESKNTDHLLSDLLEATATDIRRKHRSIKRLFPDFDAKTKGVENKGGLRFVDQDPETWKFKIHSGTQADVWYDAYLHFKDIESTLERFVKDRSLWAADKKKVDYRQLSKQFMTKVDIQLFCSCPAFLYWGPAYILSLDKYDAHYVGKEERPPSERNPKRYGAVCKHLDRLLKVLPFYGSTMSKWIKDFYGKDITKWEQESQEEFMGGARAAQAAMQKRREEAPEIEPEKEPEEKPEEETPVTDEMDKEVDKLKKERPKDEPKEKPEEPEEEPKEEPKEKPEEEPEDKSKEKPEKPEEKPKKRKPGKPAKPEEPKPEWSPDAGKRPEEDYF